VNKTEIIEAIFPIIERSESAMPFINGQLTKKFLNCANKDF